MSATDPNCEQEKYNEQLNQETIASWEEVEQKKIVSHQVMLKWLDTWGTVKESDTPPVDDTHKIT